MENKITFTHTKKWSDEFTYLTNLSTQLSLVEQVGIS